MAHRLLANQGRGGEHHAGLQETGEGLSLAVTVAVLAVWRGGGIADRNVGGHGGGDVEGGIRQRGQGGDGAGGEPGKELDGGQHHGRRH